MIVHPVKGEHVSFWASGLPETKGSFVGLGGGRVKGDNPREPAWREAVGWAAKLAMRRKLPLTGGALVTLDFVLPAPIGNKNKRDVDKLCRSCLDAMTRLVYIDDENVRGVVACKELASQSLVSGVPDLGVEVHVFPSFGFRARDLIEIYLQATGH